MDGRCIDTQRRRFADLDADEMLSWCYYLMVRNMDGEQRRVFDRAFLSDDEVSPDWLPESLRGQRPPDWWTG